MKINDPTTTSSTPHPIYFHSPLDQTMKGLSILAILLYICSTGYNNASSYPSILLVEAKTTKIRETPSSTKNNNVFSKKKNNMLHPQTKSDKRRVFSWVSIVVLVNILFFFRSFAAPFFDPLGEPRQATASSVYFSFLAFLYIWLASVTTLTVLPQFSTNYNIIIAAALFFYMVFVSIIALLMGRLCIRGLYYCWLFWRIGSSNGNALESIVKGVVTTISTFVGLQRIGAATYDNSVNGKTKVTYEEQGELANQLQRKLFPELIAFQRPFRRVFKTALFLSAALCFVYSHCWSRSMSAFESEEGGIVCRVVFFPFQTPVREQSIWVLWAFAIGGHLWAYIMNEFAGKHSKDYRLRSSYMSRNRRRFVTNNAKEVSDMEVSNSSDSLDNVHADSPIHGVNSNDIEDDIGEDEEDRHFFGEDEKEGSWHSIIQKLARRKLEQPSGTLPMVSWYSNIIFSTGFDMLLSFKVFLGRFDARKMQVALLEPGSTSEKSSVREGVFDFTNRKHYNTDSDENGFWFDFVSDVGDGFNSSYQVSRLLAQQTLDVTTPSSGGKKTLPRGSLLINGGDLAYPDPTPENYEKRFFRTFEDALPPPPSFRKEHISIRKPALPVEGWNMEMGSNEGTESEDLLSKYPGPCCFLIPGNHDWFDGLSTFTRYILSRDWLGGWLLPQRTSYFAIQLPKGWWILGFDLALDDDINIEQFKFFSEVAASMKPDDNVIMISHVPHWVLNEYENHSHDSSKETHLTELVKSHLKGRVKLRLAGDLHHYTRHVPVNGKKSTVSTAENQPVLIVSGGGGAFLHPTHCFQDEIQVGVERHGYSRVCAYPSSKVSRNLSWMNLWQFRWRNWRLDILWAVTHFGVCCSLFPLCGVYDDYLASNPTHHLGSVLLWVFRRVLLLFAQIFSQGRVSLLFTVILMGIAYTFTDSSNLKWRTHLAWSMLHALCQISSALICILFVEFMAEFVVSEGLVATAGNIDGVTTTQSCGTGLANTIYDEYTIHFSHTLEDFQLLNTTNSTDRPPDLLESCRFDEKMYQFVSSTLSWLYHEAPFLKSTLSVFDLPGIIGAAHAQMCHVLCSGGAECTYSNDFLLYQQLGRGTILKYLASISLYYVIFAVPLAGNVFGMWLAIALNFLGCQYDEGFSSLRMEHWKNFLRMHIDEHGDLEIHTIGLHRVPKKWRKDPAWDGVNDDASTKPSWMWKRPSKWIPWRNRSKFTPQMIDYTKIKRTK